MKKLLEPHAAISKRHDVTCNKPLRKLTNGMLQCPVCCAVHHGRDGFHDISCIGEQLVVYDKDGNAIGYPSLWKDEENVEAVIARYFERDTNFKREDVTYELEAK